MFESLDSEVKKDEHAASTPGQRWLRYGAVLLASVVMFGLLYAAVVFYE